MVLLYLIKVQKKYFLVNLIIPFLSEGEDCEIQFGETVLLPAADAYRRDRPDYDPNFDDLDDMLQFYIALDVREFNEKFCKLSDQILIQRYFSESFNKKFLLF